MWLYRCSVILFLCFTSTVTSQSRLEQFLKPSDTLNKSRRNAVVLSEVTLSGITLVALNNVWYADFERSKFHTINDNSQWLQMDKFGHVFTSYQMGKLGANLLNWSGVRKQDQLLYGATLGFGFLTAVEILDGYSKEWGFSWGDVGANALGTGLYISQELLWNEQRINVKFGFRPSRYADLNPEKLGNSFSEQVLKDYNGQTYWLSFNLYSFFKGSKIPKWLNVTLGYGGEGMLTGTRVADNQMLTTIPRFRQFYLSLDVNLSNLRTKSALLKSIFNIFNMIKIPFPTLEFNKKGAVFHLLHY
ncbi:DUF2279 domain-containing protein [Hyunsoonleella ulvae]|uniref:DUF2279 domain-containing protein n=1 Tax=Hyunsoonleella ulvae TaxID=2799948 RepID=UPI00193AA12E|nr:DUF2279 domain-containing protein [Hyunsoonleella ulvae]